MYIDIYRRNVENDSSPGKKSWAWAKHFKLATALGEHIHEGDKVLEITGHDSYCTGWDKDIEKDFNITLSPSDIVRICNFAVKRGLIKAEQLTFTEGGKR